ncbi:hypothetical protein [Gloeobacter morelensis]|nr:hypothetical protein [Gloeobacter morelensis]
MKNHQRKNLQVFEEWGSRAASKAEKTQPRRQADGQYFTHQRL